MIVFKCFPKLGHKFLSANCWFVLNNGSLSVISNQLLISPLCTKVSWSSALGHGKQLNHHRGVDDNPGEDVPPFPSWETVSCVGWWTIQDRHLEGPPSHHATLDHPLTSRWQRSPPKGRVEWLREIPNPPKHTNPADALWLNSRPRYWMRTNQRKTHEC